MDETPPLRMKLRHGFWLAISLAGLSLSLNSSADEGASVRLAYKSSPANRCTSNTSKT